MSNIEEHFKENCLHHCHSHKSLTIGSDQDEPQSYLYINFPFSSSSPLKRALKITDWWFSVFYFLLWIFLRPTEEGSKTNISFGVIKNYFHSMVVWTAWEPPLYTYSTSHSLWTRNQRATSMIFGTSTQNTWMKKRTPQKQGLTRLDFEINVKKCQKMSKNAKNRENSWSSAMSCNSETSMVRGGFFYIISKIMHERTTTESLVTIARWFFFQL